MSGIVCVHVDGWMDEKERKEDMSSENCVFSKK